MVATATLRRHVCREFGRRPAAVVVFGENVRRAVPAPLPDARGNLRPRSRWRMFAAVRERPRAPKSGAIRKGLIRNAIAWR